MERSLAPWSVPDVRSDCLYRLATALDWFCLDFSADNSGSARSFSLNPLNDAHSNAQRGGGLPYADTVG